MKNLIYLFTVCLFVLGCGNEELEITRNEKNIIVEAYLENGEIPRFLIHESSHLNEKLSLFLLWKGEGRIITPYDTIKVSNPLSPSLDKKRVFNYFGEKKLENLVLGDSVHFEMEFNDGRKISSKTSFLPKLVIQEIQTIESHVNITFNSNNIEQHPYFLAKATSLLPDTSYQSSSHYKVNTTSSDYLNIALRLKLPKQVDNSLEVELFRITKDHYEFLSQMKQSKKAQEAPEESPATIQGNIENAIGIFTFIQKDQKTVYF